MITLHTNFGDIKIELNAEKAPETSANFLQYCRDGFYDNTVFHRVIDGFMIQGGGMESGLREKPTRAPIKNEANNGLSNKVGSIAMARTMDPHSASSQFFINVNNNTFLDFRSESLDGWVTACSVKLLKVWTWLTKSKALAQVLTACTKTYH